MLSTKADAASSLKGDGHDDCMLCESLELCDAKLDDASKPFGREIL